MADRRPLTAGLKPATEVDPVREKDFVFHDKAATGQSGGAAAAEARPGKRKNDSQVSRVPLTTRIREDYAAGLKRASLERQLKGEFPNTMLDILEEALEPWLRSHGYIQ
jgi:hypothetical protein